MAEVDQWAGVFEQLEGIYAFDTGSDSGIRDELLRRQLVEKIDAADPDEIRLAFSRFIRDRVLSEEALAQGYGWEDVKAICDWFDSGEYRGRERG